MSLVFINNPVETFTPTQSGALATVIWECCRAAAHEGSTPFVITRSADTPAFGWENTIFVGDVPKTPNRVQARFERIEHRISGWRYPAHRQFARAVAGVLRERRLTPYPLVLHNDPETAIYLREQFPEATIIHGFHNNLPAHIRIRNQLEQSVNAIYAVSDFTARWVRDFYNFSMPVHTIYNGVDIEHFAPAETKETGKPIINFVGRTGIEKAPDVLLRAARRLARRTKNFGLQIIGSNHWDKLEMDTYQRHLLFLVQELRRDGIEVRLPGHIGRADLPDEIRKAQIHVVPSRWDEPFGLVTLEGMACGLATVASRTGGTPEVLGDAGLLFERDNVEELSDHLYALVSDEELRQEYSTKARERALGFSWNQTWRATKALAGQ